MDTETEHDSGLFADAPPPDAVLTLANRLDQLPRLTAWLDSLAERQTIPLSLAAPLNLAIEEWVVNVIRHGLLEADEQAIAIGLWREPDAVRLVIEDGGRPFDPTVYPEPDLTKPLSERSVGGLGIHFIRRTMDAFGYQRLADRNRVTLLKRVAGALS